MGRTEESSSFKRRSPRRFFSGSVGLLFGGKYAVTQGVSLGEGGLAFLWPTSLTLNIQVVVTFKIPGENMISVRGILRNVKTWERDPTQKMIGVQFLPLPMGDKRRIRAFVSSRPENEPVV